MEDWEAVQQALRGLKFGSVTVVVQDGVIVLIERTEKRRVRTRQPASGDTDRLHQPSDPQRS